MVSILPSLMSVVLKKLSARFSDLSRARSEVISGILLEISEWPKRNAAVAKLNKIKKKPAEVNVPVMTFAQERFLSKSLISSTKYSFMSSGKVTEHYFLDLLLMKIRPGDTTFE